MNRTVLVPSLTALTLVGAAFAGGEVAFDTVSQGSFFVPFDSGNAGTVIYGDSGWLGGPGSPPEHLQSIILHLATYGSSRPGTTDIKFTFNDGDRSGLVFGTGAELYSTTIVGVELPAAPDGATFFSVMVPLPGVSTTGNYNDVGWSIALENFQYDGQFGFQTGNCFDQAVGFYTNNASWSWDGGANWGLFAFGPDTCLDIAQYAVTIIAAPPLASDLNGDGEVDGDDLGTLLGFWGLCLQCPADLNGDGVVDGDDLGSLLGEWTG